MWIPWDESFFDHVSYCTVVTVKLHSILPCRYERDYITLSYGMKKRQPRQESSREFDLVRVWKMCNSQLDLRHKSFASFSLTRLTGDKSTKTTTRFSRPKASGWKFIVPHNHLHIYLLGSKPPRVSSTRVLNTPLNSTFAVFTNHAH